MGRRATAGLSTPWEGRLAHHGHPARGHAVGIDIHDIQKRLEQRRAELAEQRRREEAERERCAAGRKAAMERATRPIKAAIREGERQAGLKYAAARHSKGTRQAAILAVLAYLEHRHRKTYAFPSQEKLLSLLWRMHGIQMSRRTLNRDLAELEGMSAIARTRRHTRKRGAGFVFRSTLYQIKRAALGLLAGIRRLFDVLASPRVPNSAQHPLRGIRLGANHGGLTACGGPPG